MVWPWHLTLNCVRAARLEGFDEENAGLTRQEKVERVKAVLYPKGVPADKGA